MEDIRSSKMCAKGARRFFVRHDLDWQDFIRNGIEAEKVQNIQDAMCQKVIEVARERRQ
jgi:uncharacterized NAD(P)/FAD-binding protein YdhS